MFTRNGYAKAKSVVWALMGMAGLAMAASAHASVSSSERVLVIVSELDSTGVPELRPIYSALEGFAVSLPRNILGSKYRQIRVLSGNAATARNFKDLIYSIAADPSVDAIDTIIALHGADERLRWANGGMSMDHLRDEILVGAQQPAVAVARLKKKLRVLYSLACFGESHRAEWRQIGYDVVAGSKGVNANAEVEYPSVLHQWANGSGFKAAFDETNNDAALLATDGPLRAAGQLAHNALRFTDSKKLFMGETSIKITTEAE